MKIITYEREINCTCYYFFMFKNKNRGALLEEIINNSIYYYEKQDIALFWKANIPIKIYKNNNSQISGIIQDKAQPDYYGIYNGQFISLEAKSTNKNILSFNKKWNHQIKSLEKIKKFGGLGFLIIYFKNDDLIYKLNIRKIIKLSLKSISMPFCKNNGTLMEIIFPGRIDFLKIFNF